MDDKPSDLPLKAHRALEAFGLHLLGNQDLVPFSDALDGAARMAGIHLDGLNPFLRTLNRGGENETILDAAMLRHEAAKVKEGPKRK